MSNILEKPVHPALYKYTELEKLQHANKLTKTSASLVQPTRTELPVAKRPERKLSAHSQSFKSSTHKAKAKMKLKVLYERLPPIPKELKPNCENCNTQACCTAFIVPITKLEYESGIYEDNAVKLTKEAVEQLRNSFVLRWSMLQMGGLFSQEKEVYYFLEGSLGMKCPYLGDRGCSIYNHRPLTCRTYTCVGDSRITQEIKDGTKKMIGEILHE